jgi:hypothetical protein
MTTKHAGGPAFPQIIQWHNGNISVENNGMTLRDYFAAKAMQAAAHEPMDVEERAVWAYLQADAMLAERNA